MAAAKPKVRGVVRGCSAVKPATPVEIANYLPAVPSNPLMAAKQPRSKLVDFGASAAAAPVKIKSRAKPVVVVENEPQVAESAVDESAVDESAVDEDIPVKLQTYAVEQDKIITANPYKRQNPVFTSQTSTTFKKFINTEFKPFQLPVRFAKIDEQACEKRKGAAVENFLYQQFIREYINTAGPYRGILVYHGLGSGKTCSAIAAAEAVFGTSGKQIVVMTPKSLQGNFINEISFCGFKHFRTDNHWESQPISSSGDPIYVYAQNVLSLTDQFLTSVLRRPDEDHRVIWIPDFTKPSNFSDLEPIEREHIIDQIHNSITSQVTFVSYNGITAKKLKEYACERGPNGERFFDNKVVVIDEVHNLTRLMHGKISPYIKKTTKGRARKIPIEPIEPGIWEPGVCDLDLNYERAYLFYKLLTDARNSKIIALSGTPIINFPDELAMLSNILGGYMECVECIVYTLDKTIIENIRAIIAKESRIEIIRFVQENNYNKMLLSAFLEGYEKVYDDSNEPLGVHYNPVAQEDIRSIFTRLKPIIQPLTRFGEERFTSHPRLPVDVDEFKNLFINPADLSVNNEIVMKKRLTGLISYYKGSKEDYMPRVTKDKVVKCKMTNYMLSLYAVERKREIDNDRKKKKEGADVLKAIDELAEMSNASSYRFRSRALCNFAFPKFAGISHESFPKGIKRPFPNSGVLIEKVDLAPQKVEDEIQDDIKIAEIDEKVVEADKVEEVDVGAAVLKKGGAGNDDPAASAAADSAAPAPSVSKTSRRKPVVIVEAPVVEAPAAEAPVAEAPVVAAPAEAAAVPIKRKSKAVVVDPEPEPEPEPEVEELAPQNDTITLVTYNEQISAIMSLLDKHKEKYLTLGEDSDEDSDIEEDEYNENADIEEETEPKENELKAYSSKLHKMIHKINESEGSNLVYSQFKTVEGLGVLGIALKANGYEEIKIEGGDDKPRFTQKTLDSFKVPDQKRFILFTGEGSTERRTLILDIFNGKLDKLPEQIREPLEDNGLYDNISAEICKVIGITGAGAEGISLKCCRVVHIMEPYWNNVRLEQVKGRAIRICSHEDLDPDERTVEIYTYCTVFSKYQMKNHKIDQTIVNSDTDITTNQIATSDINVYNISKKKDKLNSAFLQLMKESAVDCTLNRADNPDIQCFNITGTYGSNTTMFDPNLEDDIKLSYQFKEAPEEVPVAAANAAAAAAPEQKSIKKQLKKVTINKISIDNVDYYVCPKYGSTGMIFNLFIYDATKGTETDFTDLIGSESVIPNGTIKPVGTITLNPLYASTSNPFEDPYIRIF